MSASKKLTDKQLSQVRSLMLNRRETQKEFCFHTQEGVASALQLPVHIVGQAFQRLNLEGILNQACSLFSRKRYTFRDPPGKQ